MNRISARLSLVRPSLVRLSLAFCLLSAAILPARAASGLTIFAAASLQTVLDTAIKAYSAKTGVEVRASYAASSALARQIEQGAAADIFASADLDWMDYLVKRSLIAEPTRVNLLGNTLVLIAPKTSELQSLTIDRASILKALGSDGRLITGDVNAVPVGKYAKTAMQNLGFWADIEPRLAGADNVRAALNFVAKGEAPLGIVYATDAAVEPNVKVVATFPAGSHPAIIYPFAVTRSGGVDAANFLAFLQSPEVVALFSKAGFTVLARASQTN